MNELKEKLIQLGNAIAEERKDVLKIHKSSTDEILKDCIAILSRAYTHVHEVKVESIPEKELDLLFMAHARYALLRKGYLLPDSEASMKYLAGYVDGQRKLFSIANDLHIALQQFKSAHPCTDEMGVTCPTHRFAQEAINKFDEWECAELAQPIS